MLLSTRHGLFKTTYHWHQRIFQHASRASCSLAFHLSSSPDNTTSTDNSENLTQGKITLSDYESDILISSTATGQSRNMLFEECDRHLKERLFRAAKIESFSRLLNSLQAEGDINAQELSKI